MRLEGGATARRVMVFFAHHFRFRDQDGGISTPPSLARAVMDARQSQAREKGESGMRELESGHVTVVIWLLKGKASLLQR